MADDKLRVLLIEDEDSDAALIQEHFGDYVEINHVTELRFAHDVGNVDVVLLDLMLGPTMGVETVRICRKGFPHLPIIVLTHVDDARMQAECIKAGADWYFRKGEQDAKAILRAMNAAIHAHTVRTAETNEVEATMKYLEKAKRLLEEIETRLEMIA